MWAGGMSFGSWVALTVGAQDPRVTTLLGIALPVDRYDFDAVANSSKPKFFIHGERDELIPIKTLREFYARCAEPKELVVIDMADHLFDGRVSEVADAVEDLLEIGMNEAVIVSAARTAVGKAPNGTLRGSRPDELGATAIAAALQRAPGLDPAEIDDVILGCAMPEAEQGMNVARIASLRAGIPVSASAVTVNRFCSSGLQAIAYAAERVMCGFASAIVAGGTESMSLVPMGGHKIAPNPNLMDSYPDVYLSTGLVAENHANECRISRDEQDAFALRSHQRALAAIESGKFSEEIVPFTATLLEPPNGGRPKTRQVTFAIDEGPRKDTSAEALAKLRPAFHAKGTGHRR
jgi:hypothetical protein